MDRSAKTRFPPFSRGTRETRFQNLRYLIRNLLNHSNYSYSIAMDPSKSWFRIPPCAPAFTPRYPLPKPGFGFRAQGLRFRVEGLGLRRPRTSRLEPAASEKLFPETTEPALLALKPQVQVRAGAPHSGLQRDFLNNPLVNHPQALR
jgi:hypothetical protein